MALHTNKNIVSLCPGNTTAECNWGLILLDAVKASIQNAHGVMLALIITLYGEISQLYS